MDKNKISLVIIKTALIVTVAVCLLFSLMGLAELYSFKQMVETKIYIGGYGELSPKVCAKFAENSEQKILLTYIVLFLFALNALHLIKFLIKNEKTVKIVNLSVSAVCTAALIAVIIICIPVMHNLPDMINELPKYGGSSITVNYVGYTYFEPYQSAALSIFLPFLVAAVISVIINVISLILNSKKSNPNQMEKQPLTQTENKDNMEG